MKIPFSNKHFEHFFELSQDLICIASLEDGYFKYLNPRWENLLGYTEKELLSKPFLNFIHPDDRTNNEDEISNLKKGEQTLNFENKFICKDGSIKYIQWTVTPIPAEKIMYCIGRDITERKLADQELKESEEKFKTLMQQSPFVVELYDLNGLQAFVNKAYEELWGFPAETTLNKFNVLESKEVEATGLLEYIKRAYTGESVVVPEFIFDPSGNTEAKGKGRVRWLSTSIYPLKELSGKVKNIVIVHQDVTERKLGTQALNESEEKHRFLFENTNLGVVYQNATGEIILANKASERILGISLDQMQGLKSIDSRWKATHEDGTNYPGEEHPSMISLKTGQAINNAKMCVFNPRNNSDTIININSLPKFKNNEVKPYQVVTTFEDITDQKKAKQDLEDSEDKYRTLFESSATPIWLEDFSDIKAEFDKLKKEGVKDFNKYYDQHPEEVARMSQLIKVIDVNQSSVELMGAKDKETLKKSIPLYFIEESLVVFREELIALAHGKDKFKGEILIKDHFGKEIFLGISLSVPKESMNSFDRLIFSFYDITERKKMENNLQLSEKKFRSFVEQASEGIYLLKLEKPISVNMPVEEQIKNLYEGYIIEANDSQAKMYGFDKAEELYGMTLAEFHGGTDNPENLEFLRSWIKSNYRISDMESKEVDKDGNEVWFSNNTIAHVKDGYLIHIWGSQTNITERKKMENDLFLSEKKFRSFVEQASEGIYFFEFKKPISVNMPVEEQIKNIYNGYIIEANDSMAKMYGFDKAEELYGLTLASLHGSTDSPENIEFLKSWVKENYRITDAESKEVDKDGNELWFSNNVIGQVKDDYLVHIWGTQSNITEKKQAEIKLHQSNQLLEASQIISQVGGWELDLNTKEVFWTAETYRIHDTSPEKFNPTLEACVNFFLPKSKCIISEAMKIAMEKGEGFDLIVKTSTTKGRRIDVRKTCEVTFLEGRPVKLTGIFQDITKLKQAEQELINAKNKAEESDRLKSSFLANMSHEIRTPMNGILGFINLLNEPNLNKDKIDTYSRIINKSGERLLNTINDIIDISKISAGEIIISNTENNINNEMDELFSFFSPEAKRKGLSLSLSIDPSLYTKQITVITDNHKFHGILTNLIKNAIKFTETGSVTFGYSLKNKFIEFFVKDTGIGITKNRIQAVFNRFEQADIEDAKVFEGSGLGLAIAKAYVEMQGGEIFLESEQNKGSKFSFTLPYTNKILTEIEQIPESIDNDPLRIENLNLLIAEDDDVSYEFLETILIDSFKKIIRAKNGKEALELCRNNSEIDLVMMDIKMPIMNGYDATREIRKFNKDLIIIAQTAFILSGDKEDAIEAGCNDYISKPINKELLFEIISNHMGKKII